MNIERYAPFFQEAANLWDNLPDYSIITHHFKPKGMRKFLKVKQWLESQEIAPISDNIKQDLAEQDRIATLISKVANHPVATSLVIAYRDRLLLKLDAGKTSLKSVRLALQPAVGLMLMVKKLPTQADIEQYLKAKSGQRAALTGFVHFLNQEYRLSLKITKLTVQEKQKLALNRKQQLEDKVITYVIKCRKNPEYFDLKEWISLILNFLFNKKPLLV